MRVAAAPARRATTAATVMSTVEPETIAAARVVFDAVASPSETRLIQAARAAGTPVITGGEVVALQAEEQFVLYTGIRPTPEQIARASAFSRESLSPPVE